MEAMQATIDEETAAQLAQDRKDHGIAWIVVRPDGRLERVHPSAYARVEWESPRERHGDGL